MRSTSSVKTYALSAYRRRGLKVMEAALVLASKELGLADDDILSRERLARSILALHRAGQSDVDRLKIYAVSRFKWIEGVPIASVFIADGLVPVRAEKPR
jgi:hypothetical protein